MINKKTPLLSICIPTLNRAKLLAVLLENLSQQVQPYLDDIEIVISDNASIDNTEEVVRQAKIPIRYIKQVSTVGFAKNVIAVTCDLAKGEFVWVIGDDDLVLPNGISTIIKSLKSATDIDYYYLNFGWIDVQLRERLLYKDDGSLMESALKTTQCSIKTTQRLNCLEDLVSLPQSNSSVLFSGIFCFVTRRLFFVENQHLLMPSDSLDGSSTLIADCFPHSMMVLPSVIGNPIIYIGSPVVLQGINAWEWGEYALKNMIFGTYQFFLWLQDTSFSSDAMQRLWESYYVMAGRLFARMESSKQKHKGIDIVLEEAIPFCAAKSSFWDAYHEQMRMIMECEIEADILIEQVRTVLEKQPNARIGIWGVSERAKLLIEALPEITTMLVWVGDSNVATHGVSFLETGLEISPVNTIDQQNIDILILGMQRGLANEMRQEIEWLVGDNVIIVSVI